MIGRNIRSFFSAASIVRRGETAFTRVEVTYPDKKRLQFYVPVSSTVEQFVERVRGSTAHEITYRMDSSYAQEGEHNFINTAILNNLTLLVGSKIVAYEIKEYEERYDFMPKYDAMLLEEFERQVPTGVQVKQLRHLKIQQPQSWQEYAKPLEQQREKFLTWYEEQMSCIKKESTRAPYLMLTAMAGQWVTLFIFTYGLWGWDVAEPISYLLNLSTELALFLGFMGMEERYRNSVRRRRQQILDAHVTNFDAHMRLLSWRLLYIRKKIASINK